jgi:hypothetical protein
MLSSLCLYLYSWRFSAQFHMHYCYAHVYYIAKLDIIMTRRTLAQASEMKP